MLDKLNGFGEGQIVGMMKGSERKNCNCKDFEVS
jgi:hypothetical protein